MKNRILFVITQPIVVIAVSISIAALILAIVAITGIFKVTDLSPTPRTIAASTETPTLVPVTLDLTDTSTPTTTPIPTNTPQPSKPASTPTTTSTLTPTPSPVSATVTQSAAPTDTPATTPPPTPTPSPSLAPSATSTTTPESILPLPKPEITLPILRSPADGDSVAAENFTDFEWQWDGVLQGGWGFEILIWQIEEDQHYGAYDARELTEKLLKHQPDGTYTASFKVEAAQSVTQHRAGDYYWSVVVVQLDPKYERIGSEALPHKLHISIGGGEDGGPGSKPPPP